MSTLLVVDTDVMIGYLRARPEAVALVDANMDRIALPAMVVAELYAGVRRGREEEILDNLISALTVIPASRDLATAAGRLKRDFGKSHGVGLIDAIVAVTVQAENAELATLNVKHFPMLAGLKAPYVKA
ncbi:MAG: type II toxin-antitoxin system VapC family toxin [Phycisphaerae bacterium]